MKKRFLMGLAVVAAASMLCGFDSAETLDSLSEKMSAAGTDTKSMSIDMDINLDMVQILENLGGEYPTTSSGSIQTDITLDPFAMKMDGSMDLSYTELVGWDNGAQTEKVENTYPMEAYYSFDTENGIMTVYTKDPESGSWEAQSQELGLDMQELMGVGSGQSMSFGDMAELGLNFELSPDAADVDGAECYLISCKIDYDTINTLLQKASEMTGQDLTANQSVRMALLLLQGAVVNLEYYVDASTYLPVKLHIDLNDSDFSEEMVINDCSFDATLSYNTADEIVIPDEALAAPVTDITDKIAAAVDAATSDIETAVPSADPAETATDSAVPAA